MITRSLAALLVGLLVASPHDASAAGGSTLSFSTKPSPDRVAIEKVLSKQSGSPVNDKWLQLAEVDIDGDGTPEVFAVAMNSDYYCGDAGCIPVLLQRQGKSWRAIDFGLNSLTNGQPEDWSIAPDRKNGHVVFVMSETTFTTRFVWDGTGYTEE